MNTDRSNSDRAKNVDKYVCQYALEVGDADDNHICLVDFLADLRHWADVKKVGYEEADRQASNHYAEEIIEEKSKKRRRKL